jgi:hypothetical protein
MDYYESVVMSYLRSDRALFLNTEFCLQLVEADNPDSSGPHWYCDAVACDFRKRCIFLCEISYGAQLSGLKERLRGWHENWNFVCEALIRDSFLPKDWPVRVWLFVPEHLVVLLLRRFEQITGVGQPLKFAPLVAV